MADSGDASGWSVDQVVYCISKLRVGYDEDAIRNHGVNGERFLDLVDEPISVLQEKFGCSYADSKLIRTCMRQLRLQSVGFVDVVARAVKEGQLLGTGEDEGAAASHDYSPAAEALLSTRSNRLNIVAIGKTGQGKSSTLNTFLHYNGLPADPFAEVEGMKSGTKAIEQRQVTINGLNIRLVDTIGLFDTDEEADIVMKELARVVQVCSEGIHAFLIVVKSTERMTTESRRTIDIIRQYFGNQVLKYAFFIMTCVDQMPDAYDRDQQVQALSRYVGFDVEKSRVVFFDNRGH